MRRAAVGGQDDAGLSGTLGHDLEQCGAGFAGQREAAELVGMTSRVGPSEESHGGGPPAFDRGAVAAGGEVGGGGEVACGSRLRLRPGRARRPDVLPTPGGPIEEHAGGGPRGSGWSRARRRAFIDAGRGVEVEVGQSRASAGMRNRR